MLRMPQFEVERPTTLADATRLLRELGEDVMLVAGGTDLIPNIKHELFTPKHVVALAEIEELRGIVVEPDGTLVIGAMTPLAEVATHADVARRAPALAQATSLIAGPQLRRMGTLGGNVLLDTRCQWYNQTYFWREALGFCLKKDGTKCHVVESGSKCVAAASNDSAPALMSLGAELVLHKADGERRVALDDFWRADGMFNKKINGDEILTSIRVPAQSPHHRGAYGKLRDRGSIDFPLFGVAVRLDLESEGGAVSDADAVVVALQARPVRIKKTAELLASTQPGTPDFDTAVQAVADQAYRQCHPMPNVLGDHDHRREMVPVYVRRTLQAAARGEGPVHHV